MNGLSGCSPARYGGLPRRDLVERAAEMDRAGALAPFGLPGDGTVEREVHLEDARSVAVALEGAAVAFGKVLAGDVEELARRHVEEYGAGPRHVVDRTDRRVRVDFAAK